MNILKLIGKKRLSLVMSMVLISFILKLPRFSKEVELILDNCPPTFDFTEVDDKTVEEIDLSILVMEKVNGITE